MVWRAGAPRVGVAVALVRSTADRMPEALSDTCRARATEARVEGREWREGRGTARWQGGWWWSGGGAIFETS